MKEKTYVADIDRTIYDIWNDDKDAYHMQAGLTEDIVQKISDEKDDPVWMREFRMKSLQIYRQMQIPDWGPPIDGLDSMIVSGFADDVSKELPDFLETFYLQNKP